MSVVFKYAPATAALDFIEKAQEEINAAGMELLYEVPGEQ